MLYLKRKFDIRQWVLINSVDGRVYMYKECYVRTSSKEYTEYDPEIPSSEQIYMQLTNNAVQKNGDDYGKFEEGNIISTDTLFDFVASIPEGQGKSKADLIQKCKEDMTTLIVDSMKAVKGKMNMHKNTFELLGYDFIIDE